MLLIGPIVRKPKESEMSLSTQVKESLEQAASCLRDALAFSARIEHPLTINTISDILCRLESLEHVDELMSQFGGKNEGTSRPNRG
jgi:hypothetical protein